MYDRCEERDFFRWDSIPFCQFSGFLIDPAIFLSNIHFHSLSHPSLLVSENKFQWVIAVQVGFYGATLSVAPLTRFIFQSTCDDGVILIRVVIIVFLCERV